MFLQLNTVRAIGGNNGNSDGFEVLEKIVHSLISPQYLSSISWTGRGKANEKKVALSGYTNIMNLITLTVHKADAELLNVR